MEIRSSEMQYQQARSRLGRHTRMFVDEWVQALEPLISAGARMDEAARKTAVEIIGSLRNDKNIRITPPMFAAAVKLLATHWKFGHELRCWNNHALLGPERGAAATRKGLCASPSGDRLQL